MLYKNRPLAWHRPKADGKNRNAIDGFYRDGFGHRYFVKQPSDRCELFTELFAGLLLAELKTRGFLPAALHDLLIVAEPLLLDDGQYALIQPAVEFDELWKRIGTGFRGARSVVKEMFFGKSAYPRAIEGEHRFYGLAESLACCCLRVYLG